MEEMSGGKEPSKLGHGVRPRPPQVKLIHVMKVDWALLCARHWARG